MIKYHDYQSITSSSSSSSSSSNIIISSSSSSSTIIIIDMCGPGSRLTRRAELMASGSSDPKSEGAGTPTHRHITQVGNQS